MSAQNPDGPYPDDDKIIDPNTGTEYSSGDYLDMAHLAIRAQEIIRQDAHPIAESAPIPPEQLKSRASAVLEQLQSQLSVWSPDKVTPLSDGRELREYSFSDQPGQRITSQLIYETPASPTPVQGNTQLNVIDGNWAREYYFEAVATDDPRISYDDYPYHEEGLGRPQRNNEAAVTGAQALIGKLPTPPTAF